MKKLLSLLLSISVLTGLFTSVNASYTDIDISASYRLSALRLQDLGIITGYEDGSFRPDNSISRAEFTKIIVCMMGKEDEASASGFSSGFYDIAPGAWYTPYINYAVSQNILSGYADGSFAPDNTINFAEALTILLRTLGYEEENVGYFWPNNYINLAATLGISNNISLSAYDAISRSTAAVIVDRALFAKPATASNSATNAQIKAQAGMSQVYTASANYDTYLETVGYTVLDEALILETDKSSDNVTVLSGNMKQNNASAYLSQTQLPLNSGDIYEFAVIDRSGYLKTVRPYYSQSNICSVTGAVNKLTENTIEFTTTEGLKSSFRADENFIVYNDGSKLPFNMAREKITSGIDITFYGNNYGMWNIAVIGGANDIDPILAGKNYTSSDTFIGTQPIIFDGLTVYRNGEAATLSDIKSGDVVYYNTKTNVMDVYSKKVTGTYYAAYPSKAYVESISVAGKTYDIGYSAATNKLDASFGAFEIGDKITLMLGKNDKVVFVSDTSSSFDYSSYGIVLGSDTKIATEGANEGSSEYITKLFMTDGETHDIVTNKTYSDYIGSFVRINYSNGVAALSKQTTSDKGDFDGKIDLKNRTINGKYFLKDGAIIQITFDENVQNVSCEILNFDTLSQKNLNESQIVNVISSKGFNDIAILVVKNFENTSNFGVITGIGEAKSGYTIFSNGKKIAYNLGNTLSISTAVGAGVQFRASGNVITSILPLQRLNSTSSISAVDHSRIKIGNTVYNISDNVQVFDITDKSNIKSITMDDLIEKNISSVNVYSDKRNDGTIKVITASIK